MYQCRLQLWYHFFTTHFKIVIKNENMFGCILYLGYLQRLFFFPILNRT